MDFRDADVEKWLGKAATNSDDKETTFDRSSRKLLEHPQLLV